MTRYKKYAVKRIKSKISRAGIDALLLVGQGNIEYLAGYHATSAMMLITRKGKPLYFVDAMNRTLAEKQLHGIELKVVSGPGSVTEALAGCIKDRKIKKIGVNTKTLSVAIYDRISELVPKAKLIPLIGALPAGSILDGIRKIKFPEEIRILRMAAKETIRIWMDVRRKISTGTSEQDIAAMIDICVRGRGYRNSFPTIAAIAKNTAFPHAAPTAKRLKNKEHLLVDFGIRFRGYCSDLTRIYDNGRINGQIRGLRKSVRKAHDLAVKKIRPGLRIGSLADEINNSFRTDGFGDLILHGLGHGLGISVHEEPFLRAGCCEKLREGMVITIEPGLYKPDVGGIREEDMVLVTAKGCEVLTK